MVGYTCVSADYCVSSSKLITYRGIQFDASVKCCSTNNCNKPNSASIKHSISNMGQILILCFLQILFILI